MSRTSQASILDKLLHDLLPLLHFTFLKETSNLFYSSAETLWMPRDLHIVILLLHKIVNLYKANDGCTEIPVRFAVSLGAFSLFTYNLLRRKP